MKGWIDCPECNGTGTQEREVFVTQSFSNDYGFPDMETVECDKCAGTGQKLAQVKLNLWRKTK